MNIEYFAGLGIEYFIGLIALAGLLHKSDAKCSIFIFFGALATYKIIYEVAPIKGAPYYLLSSISPLLIIYLLLKIPKPTRATLRLEDLAILLILCNLFGWVAYELYYEPLAYNVISRVILIAVVISTILKGESYVGESAIHNYTRVIFGHNRQGVELAQRNQKKDRP